MKLKNYTRLETNWLRQAVAAVKPSNVTKFDISIKNSSWGNKGKAYWNGCSYHSTNSPLVTIGLSAKTKYPYRTTQGKGYIGFTLYTLKEVAVFIIAHELRHLWQAKVKRGWRVWGSKGRFSERDADAYAIHKVREYRRGELPC
jgi:hypothetical protein